MGGSFCKTMALEPFFLCMHCMQPPVGQQDQAEAYGLLWDYQWELRQLCHARHHLLQRQRHVWQSSHRLGLERPGIDSHCCHGGVRELQLKISSELLSFPLPPLSPSLSPSHSPPHLISDSLLARSIITCMEITMDGARNILSSLPQSLVLMLPPLS